MTIGTAKQLGYLYQSEVKPDTIYTDIRKRGRHYHASLDTVFFNSGADIRQESLDEVWAYVKDKQGSTSWSNSSNLVPKSYMSWKFPTLEAARGFCKLATELEVESRTKRRN